ncbi:MAG TPA: hypothetical protein VI942_01635, partial [Thermoanaerobaculia bacterium]|nr:hypothetical protein [Thermoanaerobaculia bacterium]
MSPTLRPAAPFSLLVTLLVAVPLAAESARPRVATAERAGRSLAARDLGPDPRPIVTHRRPAEAGLT